MGDYSRLGYVADVLVCSVCCRIEDRAPEKGGKQLYIMTLSVLKPYRRHSLSSQLLQWVVDKAESKDGQDDCLEEICLHVQTSNEAAIAFYKTFDFQVAEEIKNYYSLYSDIDPPDCYVLRRTLSRAKVS